MADQTNPQPVSGGTQQSGSQGKGGEVTAEDLLSLWGMSPSAPAPARPPTPAVSQTSPSAPRPPATVPPGPVSAPPLPSSAPPRLAPALERQPAAALPPKPTQQTESPAHSFAPPPPRPVPAPPPPTPVRHAPAPPPPAAAPPRPSPRPAATSSSPPPLASRPESAPAPRPVSSLSSSPTAAVRSAPKEPIIEGEIVGEPKKAATAPGDTLEESEDFGEKAHEFLSELNIRGSGIFKVFGCLVGVAAIILGGIYGWRYFGKPRFGGPQQQKEKPAEVEQETGIEVSTDIGSPESVNPRLIGFTGIESLSALGQVQIEDTPLTRYVNLFKRLENAYNADVIALLNSATDRRARVEVHIALLKRLMQDASEFLARIRTQRSNLELAYESEQKNQDDAEANFFEQLNALNSEVAQQLLETFIASSKRGVDLRARFKALGRIEALYAAALPKVGKRIQDLELNKEALIAGIKIYDVQDSDLNLVVPLGAGSAPSE